MSMPSVYFLEDEVDRLFGLSLANMRRVPQAADLLRSEIDRSTIVSEQERPEGLISMGSRIRYREKGREGVHSLKIVYPGQDDPGSGRISVCSLIGAALIGLCSGSTMTFVDNLGLTREITVLDVE